jgi:peptidyl-prolyl cis-trans isomerase C
MNVSVNGVAVDVGRWPNSEVAAVRELLRQRAVARGFLAADVADDDETAAAIERLLAEEVRVPLPTEAECRRYYEAHRKEFLSGELVHARHILFQVTPGVPVAELRARAERTLAELLQAPERFDAVARELSNCPSGQQGGNLGQIGGGDTVPEFEQALFRLAPTGILREVVKTRYGFHIVAVDQRIPGETLPFEAVREQIAERLKASVEERALRQYVAILAGEAEVAGVDLQGAETPLVQ